MAALLAAQAAPTTITRITLFEPACFSLARGKPAVEEHVTAMTPAFAVAHDANVSSEEFATLFSQGLGQPVPKMTHAELEAHATSLRRTAPPWEINLDGSVVSRVPTIVVASAEDPLFEAVVEALEALGAAHHVVQGHGHRPQDSPDSDAFVT